MNRLHIFNPEHDIALASNLANFTAPHAARQLRHDLCFIPALWAEDGDYVLVDDVEHAQRAFRRLAKVRNVQVNWVARHQLAHLPLDAVDPWGWDNALSHELRRSDVDPSTLPYELIDRIRQLSHRQTSSFLLNRLRGDGLIGESVFCESEAAVEQQLRQYHRMVLKAPWSSSGRGIRFIDDELNDYHRGWLRNLLKRQGGVMAEPYYDKVKDLGMEFEAMRSGIRYLGLSLFHTTNGAYTGNVLASESVKREIVSRYIPIGLLDGVQKKICEFMKQTCYIGPFGVDMMIVKSPDGFLLHPCVEINLRRTMGHVALALSSLDDNVQKVMRISYEGRYKLSIRKLHYLR